MSANTTTDTTNWNDYVMHEDDVRLVSFKLYDSVIIGTCSLCGGPVDAPVVYGSDTSHNPPKCRECGAVQKNTYGPIIPMQKL